MRVACLLIADFPLQALCRAEPSLAEAPLLVASGPSPRDLVLAVAAPAAAAGVRPGMTVAQARQRAPRTVVRVAPPEVLAAASEALGDVAASCSPRVKRLQPGEVLLDVGGLLPRFGSEGRIAHELLRAAHRVGLEGRVGIAGSVGVARIAARLAHSRLGSSRSLPPVPCSPPPVPCRSLSPDHDPIDYTSPYLWRQPPLPQLADALARPSPAGGAPAGSGSGPGAQHTDTCIVPAGAERQFLASLPVALLEPSPATAARLACWGIRQVGELAALPRQEVVLRLGSEGLDLHRLACGEEGEPFIPDPLQEALKETVVTEHPLVELEMLLFVLHGVLSRLAARLDLRGEGFAEVLLELRLEGGERCETRAKLVAPTREVAAVLALLRLQLEARPPGAPVEGVAALVTPGKVRLLQDSLFGPPQPAPGKLAQTLARLAALVGTERVGAPAVPDTHRPGAWRVVPFAPAREEGRRRGEGLPDPAPRPPDPALHAPVLRAFRLPRAARVVTAGARPVVVQVDRLGGAVVGCAGPYRFRGEWWTESPFARDDFDVATADGTLWRIHFDRLQRRWFADGVYD